MCELGLVNRLVESIGEERAKKSLFWNTNSGGYGWSDKQGPQKNNKISASLQRINLREGVRPGKKLTGNMGRSRSPKLGVSHLRLRILRIGAWDVRSNQAAFPIGRG